MAHHYFPPPSHHRTIVDQPHALTLLGSNFGLALLTSELIRKITNIYMYYLVLILSHLRSLVFINVLVCKVLMRELAYLK